MSSHTEHLEVTPAITEQTKGAVEYNDFDVTLPCGYISLRSNLKSSEPRAAIAESQATSSSAEKKVSV